MMMMMVMMMFIPISLHGKGEKLMMMFITARQRGEVDDDVYYVHYIGERPKLEGEKWIARKHYQVLDSPQPMTAMMERMSPG